MSPIPSLNYPQKERAVLSSLARLFQDWKEALSASPERFEDYTAEDFVFDGFYPYYYEQSVRVLFVGRESRGLSGHNYIKVLHDCYTKSFRIGDRSLNKSKFHRLLFYVAYVLNNPACEWDDIPYPTDLSARFATPSGLSFAFMNLSKFSNERPTWQAIPELIAHSVSGSCGRRNFIKEQVAVLRPHVIITMNLGHDRLELLGDGLHLLEGNHKVDADRIDIGKPCLLLDSFHFSAVSKSDREYFVDPIRDLAQRYKSVWSSVN